MIVVVADTSGLLAALDRTHPKQSAARRAVDGAGALIISTLLLSEFDHVARRVLGRVAAHQAIDDMRHWARVGRAVLPTVTPAVLDTAQAVRTRYRDLRLDLADAVNVAFAAQFSTDAVLTLDARDFRAIRPLTEHRSFRLLPDDLEWRSDHPTTEEALAVLEATRNAAGTPGASRESILADLPADRR